MSAPRLAALYAHAGRQFGVFTLAQVREHGIDPRRIQRRILRGEVEVLRPGVFRLVGAPPAREAQWLAVQFHLGGEAALCRHTAARAHGLPVWDDGRVHVLTRSRVRLLDGAVMHRTSRWQPADLSTVGPLRVTTVTRTICDLSGALDAAALRSLVGHAVRAGGTDAQHLRRCMDWLGRFRGRSALGRIVAELSPLEDATRSELESRFVRLMTRAGLPPSAVNHRVVDAEGRTRFIDAVYLPQRLPIELDGAWSHRTSLDLGDDARRENAITLVGWRSFLRFRWSDVVEHPDRTVATVRTALAAAGNQGLAVE